MVDRSVVVRLKVDTSDFTRGLAEASATAEAFKRSLGGASRDLGPNFDRGARGVDHYSRSVREADKSNKSFFTGLNTGGGRMEFLVQTSLALGPALIPTLAAATPLVAGLATELGFAATGAGIAVLAFQGIGTALKAVNDFALQPTDAHLEAMRVAMEKLSPAAQDFVQTLQSLRPVLSGLQDVAQTGLFPGIVEGIDALQNRLPLVTQLVAAFSSTMGRIAADAGHALDSPFWADFMRFLRDEAQPILLDTASAAGNLIKGLAGLTMGLAPLTEEFSGGFARAMQNFADWSQGLDSNRGFQDFMAFVRTSGPVVADALASIGNALVQLVQAGSGVGLVSLRVLSVLADALAAILDSPAGPALIGIAAGLSAVSRALATLQLVGASGFVRNFQRFSESMQLARIGAGGLAIGLGVLDSQIDDSNKTMNVLLKTGEGLATGFAVGGAWGAAFGGAIGLLAGFSTASDDASEAQARLEQAAQSLAQTLNQQSGENTRATLRGIADALIDVGAEADSIDLGIPFADLVTGVAKGGTALDDLKARIDGVLQSAIDARNAFAASVPEPFSAADAETIRQMDVRIDSLRSSAEGLNAALSGENAVVEAARQAWQDMRLAGESTRETWRRLQGSVEDESAAVRQAVLDHNALADSLAAADEGMIGFRNAVREAIKGAKDFKGSIFDQTKAGDEQKLALHGVSDAWNALSAAAQAVPGKYRDAREGFLAAARAMHVNADEAKRLADRWMDLPDPTLRAESAAKRLAKAYNELPKDVRVRLSTLDADATEADVRKVLDGVKGLTDHDWKVIMAVVDQASGPIDRVRVNAEALGRTRVVVHVSADITAALESVNRLFGVITTPQTVSVNTTTFTPGNTPGQQVKGRAAGGIQRRAQTTDRPILWGEAGPESYIPLVGRSDPRWAGAVDILTQSADALGIATAAAGRKVGRSIGAAELSRRALRSDDPLGLDDLVEALAKMRAEAEDVAAAEDSLRAAREASRQAQRALNQVEDTTSQKYRDRAKAAREADREQAQAEAELSRQRGDLSKATDEWRQAQQTLIDQAVAVQQQLLGAGAVVGGAGTSVTVGGILAKINQAAKAARRFDRDIAVLRAMGLDEDVIQNLLSNAGTPEAQAAAHNLAEASRRQIREINQAQGRLESAATAGGRQAVQAGGTVNYNVTLTGPITTTDVSKLDDRIERRIRRAVRVATGA